MMIPLSPELEKLVAQAVTAGGYASVEEFVARAVTEREQRLMAGREEMRAKVEEGRPAARRGELVGADEARAAMDRGLRRRFGVSDVGGSADMIVWNAR